MNRKIKFRAKTTANGHWVYGCLIDYGNNAFSISNRKSNPWVQPETIGQFTGLTDCNGKEIYEGDIVAYCGKIKHVVEFKHGMFGYTLMDGWFVGYGGNTNFTFNPLDKSKEHEIIGNIYDNPELLK